MGGINYLQKNLKPFSFNYLGIYVAEFINLRRWLFLLENEDKRKSKASEKEGGLGGGGIDGRDLIWL